MMEMFWANVAKIFSQILKKPFSIYKDKIFKEVSEIAKKNIIFNWLRLFYVYGPGQKNDSIIPMLIETLKSKKINIIILEI